jgi:hypothetical protein
MDTKGISALAGTALLALTANASAGPISGASPKFIALSRAQTEPIYCRCNGYNGWDDNGSDYPGATIAGPTGGWPYYGWPGYPYLPDLCCGRPIYRHYGNCCHVSRARSWIRWVL